MKNEENTSGINEWLKKEMLDYYYLMNVRKFYKEIKYDYTISEQLTNLRNSRMNNINKIYK